MMLINALKMWKCFYCLNKNKTKMSTIDRYLKKYMKQDETSHQNHYGCRRCILLSLLLVLLLELYSMPTFLWANEVEEMPDIYNDYYYVASKNFWSLGGSNTAPSDYSKHNGWKLYYYLTNRGWSVEAICGMLGNATSESCGLNPGQIENNSIANVVRGGIGFIQWTNTSGTNKIYAAKGETWYDGAYQAQIIADELDGISDGWYPTSSYTLTGEQYKSYNGHDLTYITKCYFYERERGTWNDVRVSAAQVWYNILTGEEPPIPPEPHTVPAIHIYRGNKDQNYKGLMAIRGR